MKLYSVRLWDDEFKEEKTKLVPALNESEAEDKALMDDYLSCAEVAEEVNQIDEHRVIFEKI